MAPIRKRTASDVKNHWRDIVEEAKTYGEVEVTSHNRPEAVVLSFERYTNLMKAAGERDPLARLRAEAGRELAAMQEPGARAKLDKFFSMSPARLAKAANTPEMPRRKR
jgi:prevent-host-death family protein